MDQNAALEEGVELVRHARATALASLAAAAGSAMVLNSAGCRVTHGQPVPGKCLPVRDCSQVAQLLMTALPPGHRVPPQPLAGSDGQCGLVRDSDGPTAAF